jgi:energy-coupling factor transport system ATP-binding protein
VWDEVAFGPQKLGFLPSQVQQVVELSLDRVGLRNEAQLNPRDLGYSGRKRVALASALVMQTPVLVLDEPTAGLDAGEQAQIAQVLALLRQDGKTILVISHDMDFVAENVDRVMLLRQGQIALDAPAQQFFGQSVLLETSGLVAPQITRLSQALNHQQVALTVEQFLDDRKSMISSF